MGEKITQFRRMGAGYDVTRLAWTLRDLPVELVGRIRGDR